MFHNITPGAGISNAQTGREVTSQAPQVLEKKWVVDMSGRRFCVTYNRYHSRVA